MLHILRTLRHRALNVDGQGLLVIIPFHDEELIDHLVRLWIKLGLRHLLLPLRYWKSMNLFKHLIDLSLIDSGRP
jgi:hypothetical protein